jgi:hypothetical protein
MRKRKTRALLRRQKKYRVKTMTQPKEKEEKGGNLIFLFKE